MSDELRCTECSGYLSQNADALICESCGKTFPLFDEIPVFGSESDVSKWNFYHTDDKNAHRISSGEYISDVPSKENAFYSRVIPDFARRVLDCGGGMGTPRLTGLPIILMRRST